MSRMTVHRWTLILVLLALAGGRIDPVWAQAAETTDNTNVTTVNGDNNTSVLDRINTEQLVNNATQPQNLTASLEILILLTVLSLVPSILIMTTCFTRIVVVLALLRQAIGTQQLPPSQVITALALFMTFFVMAPTWQQINARAIQPYVNPAEGTQRISGTEMMDRSVALLREFMIKQINNTDNTEDVYLFVEFNDPDETMQEKLRNAELQWQDVPTAALIPAFMTSELKQAFLMGFYIYLPFLVIDMVIASILMSMGMMMLPPILISLPFKLLLFVMVDGWHLVVGTLLSSFTNNPVV